ncbi:PQQ-binding-like beta-propeller repeat protein [Streptomyces zhihengii]
MQIIIAAAVAIVLIVVGGIVYASSGDDGKKDEAKNSSGGASGDGGKDGGEGGKTAPDGAGTEKPGATTSSKVAYQLPEPAREDLTAVPGSWVTDKAFVKPGVNSVVGYDVAKGNALWTTPLAGQVCAGSRHVTEDNKTAILFEAKKRTAPKFYEKCTEVGVLDLTTGKLLWSKSVTGGAGGDGKTQFEQVTVSGGTVAAGGLYGGAAFDLNTGAERWKPTVDADNCRDIGYAGGKALVAVRTCGEYGNQTAVVQPVNAENGTRSPPTRCPRVSRTRAWCPATRWSSRRTSATPAPSASRTSSPSTPRRASCSPGSRPPATSTWPAARPVTAWRAASSWWSATASSTCRRRSTKRAATSAAPTRSSPST